MVQLHAGDYCLALKFIRLALQTYADHGTRDGARLAGYQHALALIQEANGDSKGAALSFQISLATLARANLVGSIQRIGILHDYAILLRAMGRASEARKIEVRAERESRQFMKDNPFKYSVDLSALLSKQQ